VKCRNLYSRPTLLRFWLAEDLAKVADAPTGSDEVARGGCLLACNFRVTRSTAITEAEGRYLTKHDALTVLVTRS